MTATTKQSSTIAELKAFCEWLAEMPAVPTRHGADAMLETGYDCIEDALGYDAVLAEAHRAEAEAQDDEPEPLDTLDAAFWDKVEARL